MIALSGYRHTSVGVFGLATAGSAAVAALLEGGAEVYGYDDKEDGRKSFTRDFTKRGAHLLPPEEWPWVRIKALVLSPGVPLTHPVPHRVVTLAKQAGVPIIGDIELLGQACSEAKKIAITGTNGKSTTTTLIGHVLKTAGCSAEVGGNLGVPALALAPLDRDGVYVLELSSYQLDLTATARFDIALLLNITPDHIDRHGSMQGYVTAKTRIFDRQTPEDTAVISIDDEYSRSIYASLRASSPAKIIAVSVRHEIKRGVYVDREGILHDCMHTGTPVLTALNNISSLTGRHNWQNAAFAYAACRSYGIEALVIEKGLRSFPGLRHRLQLAATIQGIRFINDSKATNADATSHALAPFHNIYWIVGGKAKEGGIMSLRAFFPHIAHAFLIGEAECAFADILQNKVPFTRCGTLEKAFRAAAALAMAERKSGAVVLLSPACASFDQWKNFEERGDAFCAMAENLAMKQRTA